MASAENIYHIDFDLLKDEITALCKDRICIDCEVFNRARGDYERPSAHQVAWVFQKIMENAGNGTFRYLIYDRMGFGLEDYAVLYTAGGMAINNAMGKVYGEE